MAIPKKFYPMEPEHPTAILANRYDELLKRSQRQAALAREMSDKARQMIDQAIQMREKPLSFVIP
jgi:hypothetical protein